MRLIVVSNRLPFTVAARQKIVTFTPSAGGLATGLSSYLSGSSREAGLDDWLWVGWPGAAVAVAARGPIIERAHREYQSHPVFIAQAEMDRFYHGFCNSVIWPLFHYFPEYCRYDEATWHEYQKINQQFADSVLEVLQPGDEVWVHDYHLMLLPQLLRNAAPDLRIGFFLHIPFPAPDVFRIMPRSWGTAIADGLLGANVLGFHTAEYARNFRDTAQALGIEEDRIARCSIEAFPMGIDVPRFRDGATDPAVRETRDTIAHSVQGARVILSLDRLDYSKGIVNRLEAFELFLERNTNWAGRVVMMMVVIPSRVAVDQYDRLKRQIDEAVGRINGRFGQFDWTPIVYQFRPLAFEELMAVYTMADVALVTPLRDGMNLIAKEYVAARAGGPGALVLSELAGAAAELTGAIMVSPNDVSEIADAIRDGLEQAPAAQARRNAVMLEALEAADVHAWARSFLRTLRAPT